MPTLLAATVQGSKAQRQERLKTRFRDRGGTFVPSDVNPLVDILLARGINGESPVKKRAPRKSAVTSKPRPSTASRTARSKTPRPGSPKRATRKSAAVPSEGVESHPPVRKRRGALKTSKLQEGKRTNGIDTGASAGPSKPRIATERRTFADQLADAINTIKIQTVPDPCSSSTKVRPVVPTRVPGTPPLPGKSRKALRNRRTNLEPSDGEPTKSIKLPAVIALERLRREKQDGHELGASSDSDVPLAKNYAAEKSKLACATAGIRTKSRERKDDAPPPPKKRSKKAPVRPTEDPRDQAANCTETVGTGPREKNTANANPEPTRHIEDDLGGRGKNVEVLQKKTVPTKVPRKRKEHTEAAFDKNDINNNKDTHGPPEKKRRRANNTASRGKKENKEMSKMAREASAKVEMDKPIPSPMKQPARAHSKPASDAKMKPPSRGTALGTLSRRLPLSVRRRVEAISQNRRAIDDVDDPIDFLR